LQVALKVRRLHSTTVPTNSKKSELMLTRCERALFARCLGPRPFIIPFR